MKLFNKIKNDQKEAALNQLISQPYEQKYFDECKFIWKNYVPKSGQSDTLQGELLREIEKLRCEAQDNGNINWDDDYSYFCGFIKDTLCSYDIFSAEEKTRISVILDFFKECGEYALQFNQGLIPDEKVDANKIAYTSDNLYNVVCDAIGFLQVKTKSPFLTKRTA